MRSTILILLGGILASSKVFGATGVFGSYVNIFTTTSTVYVAQQYTGSNPLFNGTDLGDFELSDTLKIDNASVLTWKNGGGNVTGAEIQYRVYLTSGTPGGYTTVSFGFGSNAPSTDLGGNSFSGSGDQEWKTGSDMNLLAGLSTPGDYTVELFFRAFTNEGDRFSNNGGSNYKATFTVVPEPSAALLGGLGALALLRRRRI